jgi:hypothetical protein
LAKGRHPFTAALLDLIVLWIDQAIGDHIRYFPKSISCKASAGEGSTTQTQAAGNKW